MIKKFFQATFLISSIVSSTQASYASRHPFHHAIKYKSFDYIRQRLAANPAIINEHDDKGETPLHIAVARHRRLRKIPSGHEITNFLLENKADINQPSRQYNSATAPLITPLFAAVEANGDGCIPLLEHKADIETRDEQGFTPLLFALDSNYDKSVATLLKYKANIEATDQYGRSALQIAEFNSAVKLIKAGANLDHKNKWGKTALDSNPHVSSLVLQALIKQQGENIPLRNLYPLIPPSAPAHVGMQLHSAIQTNDVSTAKKLLTDANFDGHLLDYYHGNIPLTGAVLENNAEIVDLLLAHEKVRQNARLYIEVNLKDNHKIGIMPTALYFAAKRSASPALMQKLHALEAPHRLQHVTTQIKAKHWIDPVIFYYAIDAGDVRTVEQLLQNHANINSGYHNVLGDPLFDGKTPLEIAKERDNQQIIDLLLAHGAKIPAAHPEPIPAQAEQPAPVQLLQEQSQTNKKDLSHAIKEDYKAPSEKKDDALDDEWLQLQVRKCDESEYEDEDGLGLVVNGEIAD